MNWYKKSITLERKDWGNFLKKFHLKRDVLRKEAENKASLLGHYLDALTTMDSCKCRKCGATAKINGVFYDCGNKNMFNGVVFKDKCTVNFDNAPPFSVFTNPNPRNALV